MPKHEGYIEKLSKGPATSSHFVLVGIEITIYSDKYVLADP